MTNSQAAYKTALQLEAKLRRDMDAGRIPWNSSLLATAERRVEREREKVRSYARR